jgi:PAS domain S-box-containing protein/putative nucleotidyltransferase with HDIG domain
MEKTGTEILIAEDSRAQSDLLVGILVRNGYTVHAVEDGLQGMYKLMETRPSLIISDVWMPKMTGYEFCQTIKRDVSLKGIPVILLTSLSDLRDVVQGLEAGADYYLTKPYDEKLLLSTIESILGDRGAHMPIEDDGLKAVVEIKTGGEAHKVTVEPQKIVNYLLSTYENMLHQNRNLEQTRFELKRLNGNLGERVKEKTRFLEEEIMERKRAEEALVKSEERYRGIFENAVEGIFQCSPDGTFLSVNPAFARMFGYESPEEMKAATDGAAIEWPVDPEGFQEFRDIVAKQGWVQHFESKACRRDGHEIWIDANGRAVRDAGGLVLYYEGMVEDITESKRASEALNDSFRSLRKTLDGTVRALARTIEMRDPYTAGHQKRVAQLACAIGKELGWPGERLKGMEVIGFLHDIGKIVVPAEILSKPGVLNDLEYNMIKAHSQVGYDILKGIEFPWPVNLAVLQHHERLDGSGYPKGIKGDELIPEARILAVADVVESMASHRPYRPALGIKKALYEVSRHRGRLYDSPVVDACVNLFKNGNFVLWEHVA